IYITETGKKLLPYARHIIDSFETMEGFINDTSAGNVIRVGGSVSVGTRLLPPMIKSLENEVPDVDVCVIVDNTAAIEGKIQRSELDIAVVEGIVRSDELVKKDIYDDELVLVVGPEHELFNHPGIKLKELTKHALISRESGSVERNQFEQFLLEHDIKMKNKWSCSNTETIKKAVLNGEGIAILSRMVIEKEIAAGEVRVLNVENTRMKRKIKLIYHKNKYISQSMKQFIDICTDGRY
ncbi:MAG: LysR substrate-binding domain-containing protein, partial [Eisenbergiella sp.]